MNAYQNFEAFGQQDFSSLSPLAEEISYHREQGECNIVTLLPYFNYAPDRPHFNRLALQASADGLDGFRPSSNMRDLSLPGLPKSSSFTFIAPGDANEDNQSDEHLRREPKIAPVHAYRYENIGIQATFGSASTTSKKWEFSKLLNKLFIGKSCAWAFSCGHVC
jgi:hypothetical protein